MKKFILFFLIPCIFFILSTVYITYPLIFHLGNYTTGFGDELFIAWVQNWVLHAISTHPFSLFDANLYYPFHNTLAYSDLFFTSSILAFIPLKLIGQPIAAFNATLISSLFLLGFSTYLLSYYLTKNVWSSLLAGAFVIFSPAVLDKKVHLQILAIEWVPLSILCFLHFVKIHKQKFLILSLFFFLLQTYNSFLSGYFLVFFFIIYLIFCYFYKRTDLKIIFSKKSVLLFAITLLLLLPIIIPYYKVSNQFHSVRDLRDSIHFALQPEDFLYPGVDTRLQSQLLNLTSIEKIPQNAEVKPGYLGFLLTIFLFITLYWFIKNYRKSEFHFKIFTSTAFLGLLLSLGPFLHLGRITIHKPFPIPLPYLLFYYILPGFKGFRNSARWEMLFILCISVSIAIILPKILRLHAKQKRIFIYVLLLFAVIAEYRFPMQFFKIPQKENFPKAYLYLATIPDSPSAIFFPIYNWNTPHSNYEILRDYYSTTSFIKTVNGYSGFSPPPWQDLVETLEKQFPNETSIKMIKNLNVNYIIIEKTKYEELEKEKNFNQVLDDLKNNSNLEFADQFEDAYVFKLRN